MTAQSEFETKGFARIPSVFSTSDLKLLRREADLLFGLARSERDSIASAVRWLEVENRHGETVLRGVQNAHLISEIFQNLREDIRLFNVLTPILGDDIKSPLSTLFWKPPGQTETVVAYHQDCTFRRPAESFRNLERSYVQLGIAIDPHGPENGGMRVVPESHKKGALEIQRDKGVLLEGPDTNRLAEWGLDGLEEYDVKLEPGDVMIWSAYLLHGSPANTSLRLNRRFLVNAFMRAEDCDLGDTVFTTHPTAAQL